MVNSKEFYCEFFNKMNLITVSYMFSNRLCKTFISSHEELEGCFFLNSAAAGFVTGRRQKLWWEGTEWQPGLCATAPACHSSGRPWSSAPFDQKAAAVWEVNASASPGESRSLTPDTGHDV